MKLLSTIMIATLTCASFVPVVVAEKIKIAKQDRLNYERSWSYKLITKKTQDATPVASEPIKFNKKNAIITFNANEDEISVEVTTLNSGNKILLKRGKYTPYKGKGILVGFKGNLSLIDKDDAPFTPTHKVAVQKQNSDGKEWTIKSETSDLDPLKDYFFYDDIKIKNSTNIGKGLAVPKNKAFSVHVEKSSDDWVESKFTAEEAKRLKKIIIDKDGKARSA
jgi:hypothetical protein